MIKRRHIEEAFFKTLMILSLVLVAGSLGFILLTVIIKGLPALNLAMLTQTPKGGFYLGKEGGILNAIIGSLYLALGGTLVAMIFSLPLALYLQAYARRTGWADIVRLALDVLWGIPSIVYGAFGFTLMLALGMRASLLGGILTLAFLELPIMTRAMDEVIRMMPHEMEQAAFAVGATRLETALRVVTRQMLPGILTAVLLAFGRGIGDAASVLFTAGYTDRIPTSLLTSGGFSAAGGLLSTGHAVPGSPKARLCLSLDIDGNRPGYQPGLALGCQPFESLHHPLGVFMEAHIQIRNLEAQYGDMPALKNVTLEIPRQQITVIMGPSGCGKTTLLKSLNRFLELTDGTRLRGEVLIDGADIYGPGVDVTEIRKKTGLLAQRPFPLPMSIYDNVAYGLRIHSLCSRGCEMDTRVKHYLEMAGLWEEVKDRLHAPGFGSFDWTAATPVSGARSGSRAGDPVRRRTDLRSGPYLSSAYRKALAGAEERVYDCVGNARFAPGQASGGLCDLHVSGRSGGMRPGSPDLQ